MGSENAVKNLIEAIVGAWPTLDATDQKIAVTLYHLLVEGRPVEHEKLASHSGVPVKRVASALGAWPGVFHDDEGRVVAFWGLALKDMPHHFEVNGTQIRTWCAWDPLFIAPLLGKSARVESKDPISGETVSMTITPEGVEKLSHEDAVVSFLTPEAPWDHKVVQSFCHFVLFFTSRQTGEQWTAQHDGTFLLPVHDAYEVGRGTNQRQFAHSAGPQNPT